MTVIELIAELAKYNPHAKVDVIVHSYPEDFSITWGGGCEGETRDDCEKVNFYVDRLCQGEEQKG